MMRTFTKQDMDQFFRGMRDTTTVAEQSDNLEKYKSTAVRRYRTGESAPPIQHTIRKPSKKILEVSPKPAIFLCVQRLLTCSLLQAMRKNSKNTVAARLRVMRDKGLQFEDLPPCKFEHDPHVERLVRDWENLSQWQKTAYAELGPRSESKKWFKNLDDHEKEVLRVCTPAVREKYKVPTGPAICVCLMLLPATWTTDITPTRDAVGPILPSLGSTLRTLVGR